MSSFKKWDLPAMSSNNKVNFVNVSSTETSLLKKTNMYQIHEKPKGTVTQL